MKRFPYLAVFVFLFVFIAAPLAFGQALDGKWLQLKISFKGYAFGQNGLDKMSGSSSNYLFLSWDDINSAYTFSLFQPNGTMIPQRGETYFVPDFLEYEETARDVGMTLARDGSNYIDTYLTGLIKIKRDSQGALKNATFTSLGCEVYDGEMDGNTAFGGCTIKGKMIDAPSFP